MRSLVGISQCHRHVFEDPLTIMVTFVICKYSQTGLDWTAKRALEKGPTQAPHLGAQSLSPKAPYLFTYLLTMFIVWLSYYNSWWTAKYKLM